ncbi:hypothetical protein [Rhizobium sp. RCC_161_2]|uniref:hypothetical protein n=1 Tax=Rhizobium sp. RCC_161_2 TaxID=3239219 RepID=UPI003523298B
MRQWSLSTLGISGEWPQYLKQRQRAPVRIGIDVFEFAKIPAFDVAQSRSERLVDEDKQNSDMVAGATGIGK